MFADGLDSAWANRSHRGWATLASFAVQGLGLGVLLWLPLIPTQGLLELRLLGTLPAPPALPPGPLPTRSQQRPATAISASNMMGGPLLTPSRIPSVIPNVNETGAPPLLNPGGAWVQGGTGNGTGSVLNSIVNSASAVPPPPIADQLRVSRMMEGSLLHKVQPQYPPAARAARIQGPVVLRAIISKDGTITDLRVLSGHPLLVKAAIDAVSQWRYRPYKLNGQALEVETQVTVNFVLTGG